MQSTHKISSAFFITFNGNCKKALTLYQSCFGGGLYFDTFNETLSGMEESPVVSGSLVSGKITVYGSDLVHNEGRRVGNYVSVYVHCDDLDERLDYIKKLNPNGEIPSERQKLIEIIDPFEVRWIFGI